MKLDHEQYEILMTSLQNYRGELYIDGSNSQAIAKVDKLCQDIEDEKASLELKQERIPVTEDMYEVKKDKIIKEYNKIAQSAEYPSDVGSETGIELEHHYNQGLKLCENCDE
tara:strand:+ start:4467 stop:4802 length:336 start_codon:yes stop_codon:yes gene_type:complete